MRCEVRNCPNKNYNKASDCSFYTFPTDKKLLKKWLKFCGRKEMANPRSSFICMDHFKKEDFSNNLKFEMGFASRRLLKRDTVPTLNRDPTKGVDQLSEERERRREKRTNKQIVETLLREYDATLAANKEKNEEKAEVDVSSVLPVECNVDDPLECVDTPDDFDELLENGEEEYLYEEISIDANDKGANYLIQEIDNLENEIFHLRQENARLRRSERRCIERLREKGRNYSYTIRQHVKQIQTLKLNLQKAHHKNTHMEDQLACMFTKGQIHKIKNGFKRNLWSKADISHCIDLYVASPKAYRLLYMRGFPLPAIRTLQKWNQKGVPPSMFIEDS